MTKNRLFDAIALTIIVLFAGIQLFVLLGSVRDFGWLTMLSHDTVYQTERLLVNLHYPGVKAVTTVDLDYGSELFYIGPLVGIYDWVSGAHDPLHAFQVLVVVHILSAALGLAVLYSHLRRHSSGWAGICVLVVVGLSPLFTQWMGSIKPDANSVFLFLALGLDQVGRLRDSRKARHMYGAIVCAGAACMIKWWGMFLLFPLAAVVKALEREQVTLVTVKNLVMSAVAVFITLAAVFAINVPFFVESAKFLYMFGPKKVIGFVLLSAIALVFSLASAKIRKIILSPLALLASIGAAFLILNLPYLLSALAPGSLWYYSKYLLIAPHNLRESGAEPGGIFINAYRWILDAHSSGFMSWIVMSAFIAAMFLVFKRRLVSRGGVTADLFWFVVPFLLFLFLLIQKKNWATQAMLQPFLLAFIVVVFAQTLEGWAKSRPAVFPALVVAFLAAEIAMQNFRPAGSSVRAFYKSVLAIPSVAAEFREFADSRRSQACQPVIYGCERFLPLSWKDPYVPVPFDTCPAGKGFEALRRGCDILILKLPQQSLPASMSSFREIGKVTFPAHPDPDYPVYEFAIYQR